MNQVLPAFPTFAIIGAGALASALGPALVAAGYRPTGVVSRGRKRADRLAERLSCPVTDAAEIRANMVVCCVPDDALESVVASLAAPEIGWTGRIAFHTSGARGASVLAPLATRDAITFTFHPIQTFVYPSTPDDLTGVSVGIGGDEPGIRAATALAADLGLRVLPVRDDRRALYHVATSIASNGLVTLAALAGDLLAACGIDRREGLSALSTLVSTTADHVARDGPDEALTGPVVRGDVSTVERHFESLAAAAPGLVAFYGALVTETVRLAVRSGRLDRWSAARLLDVVAAWMRRRGDAAFNVNSEDPAGWEGHEDDEMEPR